MAIKRKGLNERVFCFIGDQAFLNGIAQESIRYAQNFDLPIKFIVADNGLSVKTPTKEVWGLKDGELENIAKQYSNVIYYKYTNTFGHSGTGTRVIFW
jgi:deoxyxylulose-5-phosphate synthase